jgi:hypothetical protein
MSRVSDRNWRVRSEFALEPIRYARSRMRRKRDRKVRFLERRNQFRSWMCGSVDHSRTRKLSNAGRFHQCLKVASWANPIAQNTFASIMVHSMYYNPPRSSAEREGPICNMGVLREYSLFLEHPSVPRQSGSLRLPHDCQKPWVV